MDTFTNTTNPDCDVCNGTGIDADFGGRCSMCWGRTSRAYDPALVGAQGSDFDRFRGNGNGGGRVAVIDGPSDKQIAFILKLDANATIPTSRKAASALIEKLLGKSEAPTAAVVAPAAAKPAQARWAKVDDVWMIRVQGMTVREGDTIKVTKANGEIKDVTLGVQYDDELWNVAAAPKAKSLAVDVPEGYYAIASKGDNDLLFVKVDRPTQGKWSGYTFVKMIVGGHEPTPIRGGQATDVLARIMAAGVVESMALYGQEIGRCGHCNRVLTDDESRARGIGPTCLLKY